MVFSYQRIQSFFPKYRDFTPLMPRSFEGILITNRKRYGTYPQKSRLIEKMFAAAFKGKISQIEES
jgi:hypothetical protein